LALLDVFLSVLREEDGEAAFFEERFDLFGFDFFYFPVVYGWIVPRFVFSVLIFLGFGGLGFVC
jgi:hypothetical protein